MQHYKNIEVLDYSDAATEFYFKANPDGCYLTVKTFIYCDVDTNEPDRFPKCLQYFLIPKTRLVVELGYFKKFLPHWAYIQDTFTKHFEQEIIENTEGEK